MHILNTTWEKTPFDWLLSPLAHRKSSKSGLLQEAGRILSLPSQERAPLLQDGRGGSRKRPVAQGCSAPPSPSVRVQCVGTSVPFPLVSPYWQHLAGESRVKNPSGFRRRRGEAGLGKVGGRIDVGVALMEGCGAAELMSRLEWGELMWGENCWGWGNIDLAVEGQINC